MQRLLEGVRSSKVLLAVIGPRWFARDGAGARLIDNPHDWIRRELVTAFECKVTVIPVFTEGATSPRPDELPRDIEQLGRQHGLPLRRIRSGEDVEAIVREVSAHVPSRRRGFLLAVESGPGPSTTTSVTRTTTTTTSQEVEPTTTSPAPPAEEPNSGGRAG